MAFSLRKRVRSKSHINSNGNDDRTELVAALHRSTKTKQKKKKHDQLLIPHQQILSPDSDIDINATSSLTDSNPIIYRTHCLCETHYDKQLLEANYNLTVDKLYDLIFGSNDFVRTYRQAQRFYDETASEWVKNESTNYRERTLKYKVPYESTFIGKGTICTREKQTLFHEVPGSHYMLETEVYNEGVKFSDTFSLIIRYCLVQTSVTTTNLCVTAHMIYNKSVNGLIKPIIERNAYSASQEGLKDLNNRLNLVSDFKMEKCRLSKPEITITMPDTPNIRRISRHDSISVCHSLSSDSNRNIRSSDPDKLMYVIIFLVILLFFIHIHLYIKLKSTDVLLERLFHLLKI